MGSYHQFLVRLDSFLHRLRCQHRKTVRSSELSALEKLPREILGAIAAEAPLPAAAALALCSCTLFSTLGTQYWERLREPCYESDRIDFLRLIEFEFPALVVCDLCKSLHPRRPRQHFFHRGSFRPCTADRGATTHFAAGPRYGEPTFCSVQAIAKKHRLGLDVKADLSALAFKYFYRDHSYGHSECEGHILDGEIVIRYHYQLFVSAGDQFSDVRTWDPCPHQSFIGYRKCTSTSSWVDPLAAMLNCRLHHLDDHQKKCEFCMGLKRCRFCDTEFRIDHKQWEGKGLSMSFTAWVNFGCPRRPTDPKWAQHSNKARPRYYRGKSVWTETQRYSSELGALQKAIDTRWPPSMKLFISPGLEVKLRQWDRDPPLTFEPIFSRDLTDTATYQSL